MGVVVPNIGCVDNVILVLSKALGIPASSRIAALKPCKVPLSPRFEVPRCAAGRHSGVVAQVLCMEDVLACADQPDEYFSCSHSCAPSRFSVLASDSELPSSFIATLRGISLPCTLDRGTMSLSGTREATHAGSWYEDSPDVLSRQLDDFLSKVPTSIEGKELPIPKARVAIAPYIFPKSKSGR